MKKGAPPYSSISGLELWLALRERIFRTIDLAGLVIFVLILDNLECLACFENHLVQEMDKMGCYGKED